MTRPTTSTGLFPSRPVQLNHIAVSVSSGSLSVERRADITRFYGDVFGWRAVPDGTVGREALVLSTNGFDQFIYITEDASPMTAPRLDHVGVSVGALDELFAVHARACAYREHDARVDIIDPAAEDHNVVTIHNMYVGYLLPLMIEVQYWEFH